MPDDLLVFNGIDGATGTYLTPQLTPNDIAAIARGEKIDQAHLLELQDRKQRDQNKNLGVEEGIDYRNIAEAGWGAVYAQNIDPAVKEALAPLLQLRREQASEKKETYFRE